MTTGRLQDGIKRLEDKITPDYYERPLTLVNTDGSIYKRLTYFTSDPKKEEIVVQFVAPKQEDDR